MMTTMMKNPDHPLPRKYVSPNKRPPHEFDPFLKDLFIYHRRSLPPSHLSKGRLEPCTSSPNEAILNPPVLSRVVQVSNHL